MELQDDGWYFATMVLGEGRYELFDLCLNKDDAMKIYPAVHKAQRHIWVQGPDDKSKGQKWLIDGRDKEVRPGTVYQIYFKWGTERLEVYWEEASKVSGGLALKYEHSYSIVGDFSKWRLVPLARVQDREGSWEGFFRIGSQGKCEFQFVRDGDRQQVIYPARPKAVNAGVPACGPDDMGKGKHFLLRGKPGEVVQVQLSIVDASVTVTMTCERGTTRWLSHQGWERHQYFVLGTFGDMPIRMQMDPRRPGVFSCQVLVGSLAYQGSYADTFQVTVDGDIQQAFYPDQGPLEVPGMVIVHGPDGAGSPNKFLIRTPEPDTSFDITLDLVTEDRRQTVTWATSPLGRLEDAQH